MTNIHIEKKVFKYINNIDIPILSFRYSKERASKKINVRSNRILRGEIYIHLQGDCTILLGNKTIRPQYGDIVLYNKEEVHLVASKPTTWERFVIFYYPEYFDIFNDVHDNLFAFFYDRKDYENNVITLPPDQRSKMIDLLFDIKQYEESNKFDQDLYVFGKMLQIFRMINNEYRKPMSEKNQKQYPDMIKQAVNYIHNNYSQAITLETIAQKIGISRSYLSALFRKHIGISPYEYLLNVRLENAKHSLLGGEGVGQVCDACGFNDYSHFIQFFKQRTGMTPIQFCKNYQNNHEN